MRTGSEAPGPFHDIRLPCGHIASTTVDKCQSIVVVAQWATIVAVDAGHLLALRRDASLFQNANERLDILAHDFTHVFVG